MNTPGSYDVAIVGGGPAGLATALFLAHRAPALTERIVVLEKERYPRDKFCAGGIGLRGDYALASIGVDVDVPSVPIDGVSLELQQGNVRRERKRIGRVVRRIEFDHELARKVRARGIRLIEGAKAHGLRVDASGATLETSAGTFRVQAVVGADGVGSYVRRAIGLPVGRYRAQVIEVDTEPVAGDHPRHLLHFDAGDHGLTGYSWDFPTVVDGQPLVCRGVYQLRMQEGADVDLHDLLKRRLAARGLDIDRFRLKRYAERGLEVHRPMSAPRVLLVGEAAGIDPLTGEGIAQAIQYGQVAGRYLAERWVRGRFVDVPFADWPSHVRRSSVGRDLAFRARVVPLFFGRYRARLERFLAQTPEFVSLGIQHFAGEKLSRVDLTRSFLSAAWHAMARGV